MSFDFVENFTLQLPDLSEFEAAFSESFDSKHGLIVEIAAIHEGLTSNYNNYSAAELEKALQSWVEPYPKPIILNHDLNTEPIGRVMAAKMDTEADGSAYVRLQVAITDPVAAQKVLDKRYLTGSVGGRAGKALCSISGEDLATEDESGRPKAVRYKKGKVYKGKLAYIDMQDISFKEYSFVNQPADSKSGVRSTASPANGTNIANSDGWVAKSSAFVLNMESEDIIDIENNRSILKEMKKKESRPLYLQLKGAFLTALAVHESENDINNSESLLSDEDSEYINSEENPSMKNEGVKEEDILAVATGLSEDLSNIAAAAKADEAEAEDMAEDVEGTETPEADADLVSDEAEEPAEDSADEAKDPEDDAEVAPAEESSLEVDNSEVQDNVDSEESAEEEDGSPEEGDDTQEEAVQEDLSSTSEEHEQVIEQLNAKVSLLEEENTKLKKALHMTLVERVVDTKIGLGFESLDDREKLISEHETRTASSLADSLRDLAKAPAAKGKSFFMPEVSSESEVMAEENVVTLGEETHVEEASPVQTAEQLFVDALMGRRKL